MNYLVSYDLNSVGKNYEEVYAAIKVSSTSVWCKPLESVWIIQSNLTSEGIYNTIKSYLDHDDRILIVEITSNYFGFLSENVVEYLKDMMQS